MISINNYIYTNNGVYRIDELYDEYKNSLKPTLDNIPYPLPKVMSFDEEKKEYYFTDKFIITKTPEDISDINIAIKEFSQIFECSFLDIFSNKTITLNCTENTSILQYNILKTETYPIDESKYGVLKYIKSNYNKPKLNLGWRSISTLINNATYMPNICLGDTIVKYKCREIKNKEISFGIIKTDNDGNGIDNLPIFICQNVENFYNSILIKTEYDK